MLVDEIKKGNIEAMKAKDQVARAIYGVVLNKILLLSKSGKEVTDVDVVQILQKTLKELNDEKENYIKAGNSVEAENIEYQKNIVSKFLPQMLSEEEIKNIIDGLDDKSIPSIMKLFKTEYAGKVDMGIVNKIARSL
ncbi:MAG: hypothetical protein E7374_01015 [Clostridiales bacterium]|nr:hypothetical protein [Clostridiales bacterium]